MSAHRVTFGSLVLSDGATERPMGTPYWFILYGENFSTGQPEPVVRTIESFMQDGSLVLREGDDNRTLAMLVGIGAEDAQALAEGEKALALELGKRNTFVYQPSDATAKPSLFQVVTSSMGHVSDDLREVMQGERAYALTITALPQAFSTTEVVTPALSSASSPTTATISDGTSATNWTLLPSGAPTVVSGELRADVSNPSVVTVDSWNTAATYVYTPAAPIDMSVTRYIQVDMRATYTDPAVAAYVEVRAYADGVQLTRIGAYANAAGGQTVTFDCPDTSVAQVTIIPIVTIYWASSATTRTVYTHLDNLKRTNASPQPSGTARQKTRLLELPGSVRSPGTLAIEHETSALGDVLVHTCPDFGSGYTPGISQWATSDNGGGGQSSNVSGIRYIGNYTATVPSSTIPRGWYIIVARVSTASPSTQTLTWTARTRFGSTDTSTVLTGSRVVAMTNDEQVVTLGTVELPATDVPPNSESFQKITLSSSVPTALRTDQVWLFWMGDATGRKGNLTQVACGTAAPSAGGSSNRLFIKSATIDNPLPGVFVGTTANESDSRFADTPALWEQHDFTPPAIQVNWVTTNALDATASFRHRPGYHSHAAS